MLCNVHIRSYPLNEQQEQITLLVILHHFVSTMYNNKKFRFIGTLMWLLHQQYCMLFIRNRWLFWYLELTISPSLTGVYVENLSEFVVRSPVEVLSLLAVGRKRLVFAETKMNRNSSRFGSNIFFFTKLLFILYRHFIWIDCL